MFFGISFPFDPSQLPPTLAGLLLLLAASSGLIVSWLVANIPFLAKLPEPAQHFLSAVLGMVLTAVATWASSGASPDTISKLNAWYLLVVQFLTVLVSTTAYHIGYRKIVKPVAIWAGHKIRVPSGSQG